MSAKLGTCHDAFKLNGDRLALGHQLYAPNHIKLGEEVIVKTISDGIEIAECKGEFGMVLEGKHCRYDMAPVSLTLRGSMSKSDVVGREIHLICEYEF